MYSHYNFVGAATLLNTLLSEAYIHHGSAPRFDDVIELIDDIASNAIKQEEAVSPFVFTNEDLTNGVLEGRILAAGDFDRFNELFNDVELLLPDSEIQLNGIELNIRDLACTETYLGDLQTNYTVSKQNGNDVLSFTVKAAPFAMSCYADYDYKLGFFPRRNGRLSIETSDNNLETHIDFLSPGFDVLPPQTSTISFCNTNINSAGRVNFEGTFLGNVATLFRGPVSNLVDDLAGNAVCDLVAEAGPRFLTGILNKTNDILGEWLDPISGDRADPLFAERNYTVPDDVSLISFQNASEDESVGDMFAKFLLEADAILSDDVLDEITGEMDLGVNVFLRNNVLDETGHYNVLLDKVGSDGFDPVIFYGQDKLTETRIEIESVKIGGLDTLQRFDPFETIGNFTVGTATVWDKVSLELDLKVDMNTSAHPEAMLVSADGPIQIIESFKIVIDFTEVDVSLALFMAVDEDQFEDLNLGSVLDGSNVVQCFLSSVSAIEISGLEVAVANMTAPVLSGFSSPGIYRIMSNFAEAAFKAYEPTLLRALPGVFQGSVRDLLKEKVFGDLLSDKGDEHCPVPSISTTDGETAILDFRDLLLDSEAAKDLGASGVQPYGSIGPMVYRLFQERYGELGDDGLPLINELLIRPYTERQSGVVGQIRFSDTFLEIGGINTSDNRRRTARESSFDFGIGVNVSLGDVRVNNVDAIASPMELLRMTETPSTLRNSVKFGNETGKPMGVTVRLVTGIDDALNEIDISATVDTLDLLFDLLLLVDANKFMKLRLGDIMNWNCWLTTLPTIDLDANGFAVNKVTSPVLSVKGLDMVLSSFKVQTECISCTTPGAAMVPELLQILEQAGAIKTLGARVPPLITSFAQNDFVRTLFDRRVHEASQFCSSSPNYDEFAVRPNYESNGFSSLDSKSIDTMLFAGVLATEVAIVAFSETQRLKNDSISDPLSAQTNFRAPEGTRLLDWTDIGNSTELGSVADEVFERARSFLNGDAGGLLNFTEFIQDSVDVNGTVQFDSELSFDLGASSFSLDSIRVTGLDSFTLFDVLEPIAPQTLTASAAIDTLSVEVLLSARDSSSVESPQTLTALFSLQNVTIDVALFAAFDLDQLGYLKLGSLLTFKSMLKCLLSSAHAIEITQMKVSVNSFLKPKFDGFQEETANAIEQSTDRLFNLFRPSIEEAIPKIFDGVGKDWISRVLTSAEGKCEYLLNEAADTTFLDFRDLLLPTEEALVLGGSGLSPYGSLISGAFEIVKKELFEADSDTGLARINSRLLADLTQGQSGVPGRVVFEGDILNYDQNVQFGTIDSSIQIRVYDAYVGNIDTFGVPLSLLDPIQKEPHMFHNTASVGVGRPLEVGARFLFRIAGTERDFENDLEFKIGFSSLRVLLIALARISEKSFFDFPIRDITDFKCWLATIPAPTMDSRGVRLGADSSLAFKEIVTSVAKLGVDVQCIECSSPEMLDFVNLISSVGASNDVTDTANALLEFFTDIFEGNFFDVVTDRAVHDAKMQCRHSESYDPNFKGFQYEPFYKTNSEDSATFFTAALIVVATFLTLTLVGLLLVQLVLRRRNRIWINSLPQVHLQTLWKQQCDEKNKGEVLDAETTSMFASTSIPLLARIVMPVVILGNIGLFLSGHLSLGGSVTIMASLAGQSFEQDNFFEFSMAKTTIDIYKAGGKELAILMFLFSFLWPYTKQVVTMVLWFTPPTSVSVKRRGSVLRWLDVLAKWSMIDVLVLVVTIVCFRISIQSPDVSYLPSDFYSVDLLVVPKWGLYANMTAQIVSQISSHFIIHYHRHVVTDAQKNNGKATIQQTNTITLDEDEREIPSGEAQSTGSTDLARQEIVEEAECLAKHEFIGPHTGVDKRLVVHRFMTPLLGLLSSCLCALIIIGCTLPSYSLDVVGVAGVLVESGQKFSAATTKYSVFTTIQLLWSQAKLTGGMGDYVGLGTLSFLLVSSVLIIPIAQTIILQIQWLMPLERKQRQKLSTCLEMLQAWQYSEVFLLAILVGSWQLGPISEYIINPFCQNLDGFFAELVFYGLLKKEDAQCFRADVAVEPSFYVLFVAALGLALLNSFIVKAVAQYAREPSAMCHVETVKCTANSLEDLETLEDSNAHELASNLRTTPVLFTELFRWCVTGALPVAHGPEELPSMQIPSHQRSSPDMCKNTAFGRSSTVRSERTDIGANSSDEEGDFIHNA